MLLAALIVTFAVASVLQSIGVSRREPVAEPSVPEPPRPAIRRSRGERGETHETDTNPRRSGG